MIFPRVPINPETNKYEVLLMVQVMDKLGAITNSTKLIEVNPPSGSL